MELKVSLPFRQVCYLFELVTHRFYKEFDKHHPRVKRPRGITNILGAQGKSRKKQYKYGDACYCAMQDEKVKRFLNTLSSDNRQILSKVAFDIFSKHKGKIKEDTLVEFKDQYKAFIIYAGYNTAKAFVEDCFRPLEFKGLYFSYRQDTIKEFKFSTTLYHPKFIEIIKDNNNSPEYLISEPKTSLTGFHTSKPDIPLKGTLSSFQECWRSRVQDETSFLDIIIHVGDDIKKTFEAFAELKLLNGIISGTGSNHSLYAGEIILMRKDAVKSLQFEAMKFLNLKRNRFTANGMQFYSNGGFKINGAPIDKIKTLSDKTYRLITAAPDGFYFQSIFKIFPDFTAEIIVPHFINPNQPDQIIERRQICRLSFDNIDKNRLLIFGMGSGDMLYSTTVINIPENPHDVDKKVLKGAYCIMDQEMGLSPMGNVFFMVRDESGFSAEIFNREKALSMDEGCNARILVDTLKKYFDEWLLGWGILSADEIKNNNGSE